MAKEEVKQEKQSYEQLYKSAKKDGKTKQVSFDITKWEEEGKVLIGRLLKVEKKSSKELGGKYDGEVNVYLFDTDEGLVSCVCGTSVDRIIDSGEYLNQVMAIEFQGKLQLDGGREVNRFRVDVISMSGGKDDIPF